MVKINKIVLLMTYFINYKLNDAKTML